MVLVMAGLLMAALVVQAPDVTGKWEGTITAERSDGSTSEDRALLILIQKGTTISGSIGGGEDDQHAITKGSIEGKKISLHATNTANGREYAIELTIEGDELKGTVTSGDRRGDVRAKRRKE